MTDREKVIKGLKGLECCVDPLKAHCFECQYYPCYDQDTTSEKLIAAALELLKAQEPVKPYVAGNYYNFENVCSLWYACGNCNKPIDPKDQFCRHCGREVKWDGTDRKTLV